MKVSRMSARADQIVVTAPLRWLKAAALVSAARAAFARLRERMREPRVPAMSDDWLRSHMADREYR